MKDNKQHVQITHDINKGVKSNTLEYTDVLVYACMKKYMNKDTLKTFVSISTIVKETKLSRDSVMRAINSLILSGDLTLVEKLPNKKVYQFNKTSDKFEKYTYDFLEHEDLDAKQKAYLILVQPLLFKQGLEGRTQYTDSQMSELTGMSRVTISRRKKELLSKGYITNQLVTDKNGNSSNVSIYALDKMLQAIAIDTKRNTEDIIHLQKENRNKDKLIEQLFNEISELKGTKVVPQQLIVG